MSGPALLQVSIVGLAVMGGTGNGNETEKDDFVEDDGMQETVVMQTDDDDVDLSDITAEVNVEELVAKLDASNSEDVERRKAIKKRLEELEEEIGDNLDGTYNINLDED